MVSIVQPLHESETAAREAARLEGYEHERNPFGMVCPGKRPITLTWIWVQAGDGRVRRWQWKWA